MVEKTQLLSSVTYDRVRAFVELILPGLGTFYFTIAQIWGFPGGEAVVATAAALSVLGGVLLRAARKSYDETYDGELIVTPGAVEDGIKHPDTFTYDMTTPLDELSGRKSLSIRVTPNK